MKLIQKEFCNCKRMCLQIKTIVKPDKLFCCTFRQNNEKIIKLIIIFLGKQYTTLIQNSTSVLELKNT